MVGGFATRVASVSQTFQQLVTQSEERWRTELAGDAEAAVHRV
jgi:hypothetical protein